jgi:hypothetical protein
MRPWTLCKISPPPLKATNWSGIKNGKTSKEICLSWYQSIDKNHFWVSVKMSSKKKKWEFLHGLSFLNGGAWQIEKFELFWPFDVHYFYNVAYFSRPRWAAHRQNFKVNTMQCISLDWYPETSILMLYAAVNAPKCPPKAANWSGIKNDKSSKKIRLSWYQSINKKHF